MPNRVTSGSPKTKAPATAPWRVRLLGRFGLTRADVTVSLPATGQRLVAFLALRGPRDRAQTAWSLWPSKAEGRALAGLRTAVWRLHRAAPGLLARTPARLALAADVELDTRALTGAELRSPGDLEQLAADCGSACPELLPGWYDDWVLMERERLRHRLLRQLESRADQAIRCGDPAVGLEWAMAAVAADPLRESAHRLVLRSQLADGNVSDALRYAKVVGRLLDDELRVPPSPQLTALIEMALAPS